MSYRLRQRTPMRIVGGAIGIFLLCAASITLASVPHSVSGRVGKVSASQATCTPGSKPSLNFQRFPAGSNVEMQSPELVLSCANISWYGPLELVGFNTSIGFCTAVDSPRQHASEPGFCRPTDLSSHSLCGDRKICSGDLSWAEDPQGGYFEVIGEAAQDVSKVKVVYRGNSGKMHIRPVQVFARLPGELGSKLGVEDRFGVFAAVFQGCPPNSGVRLIGDGKTGKVVAIARSKNRFPGFCKHPAASR